MELLDDKDTMAPVAMGIKPDTNNTHYSPNGSAINSFIAAASQKDETPTETLLAMLECFMTHNSDGK